LLRRGRSSAGTLHAHGSYDHAGLDIDQGRRTDALYRLIRLLGNSDGAHSLFLYLALDRSKANLALARHHLKRIENELEICSRRANLRGRPGRHPGGGNAARPGRSVDSVALTIGDRR